VETETKTTRSSDGLILALDPAETTGWALRSADGSLLRSGQAGPTEIEDVLRSFGADASITHLAIEDGYYAEKSSRQRINMRQFAKHEKRVGYLCGVARALYPRSLRTLWVMYPSEWRSFLRKAGLRMPQHPRAQCKKRALELAREEGAPCKGPRGGKREDEADAICISRAAYLKYFAEKDD
jgi:hypothetical protein